MKICFPARIILGSIVTPLPFDTQSIPFYIPVSHNYKGCIEVSTEQDCKDYISSIGEEYYFLAEGETSIDAEKNLRFLFIHQKYSFI